MATWIQCSLLEGEETFINFDHVVHVHRCVQGNSTRVDLVGERTLIIKQTIEELRELGVPLFNKARTTGTGPTLVQYPAIR